jgi:hypothetical protein
MPLPLRDVGALLARLGPLATPAMREDLLKTARALREATRAAGAAWTDAAATATVTMGKLRL